MIQDRLLRITMTKFRASDHKLNIEKAIRREERYCHTCKTKVVDSEEHLLLDCNLNSGYINGTI